MASARSARGRLHVSDHPGVEPAVVLMHGFPDDSRVYDRLVPLVAPRRVVVFDFAGYGRSERDLEAQDDHIAAAGEMTQAASPPDPAFWLLGATAW